MVLDFAPKILANFFGLMSSSFTQPPESCILDSNAASLSCTSAGNAASLASMSDGNAASLAGMPGGIAVKSPCMLDSNVAGSTRYPSQVTGYNRS